MSVTNIPLLSIHSCYFCWLFKLILLSTQETMRQAAIDKSKDKVPEAPAVEEEAYEGKGDHAEGEEEEIELDDEEMELKVGDFSKCIQ